MRHALYLAGRSLWYFRGRAVTIILCLGLTLWLPMTARLLLNQFQTDILARAESTPLIIGARGSRIDLALHGLYFDTAVPAETTMSEADYVSDTGFATAIPLHIRYRTQSVNDVPGVPIVGTSIDYFEFRKLSLALGAPLRMLGDCVLGANFAATTGLQPGDRILSAPKNAFNLAGDYPLSLNISGVLSPSHSPDDDVVFVDVQTGWIIDGIGHGHQPTGDTEDTAHTSVTAVTSVLPFTKITPDNIDSFHFHGDPSTFPISAVIAVPHDRKSQTLLLGRYASVRNEVAQCLKPAEVVVSLLNIVFRIERLIWLSAVLSSIATATLLGLVLLLTIRLRTAEMRTMYKLGCSRGTIVMLLSTELGLMMAAGVLLAVGSSWVTSWLMSDSLRRVLF